MKDEIKEIKIGMYTTDEILEFMTDGEGRGFMGRSMYDAIIDYITNLQEEMEKLRSAYIGEKLRNEKAISMFNDENLNKYYYGMSYEFEINNFKEDMLNILQGENDDRRNME